MTPKYCPLDRNRHVRRVTPGRPGAGSSVAPIRPASVLFAASERSGAQHHAARTDSGTMGRGWRGFTQHSAASHARL